MRIGFLSFRVAGIDGVSLEAERWRTILARMGHRVTFVAGKLDRPGVVIPELYFGHPEVYRVHQMVVENNVGYKKVEGEIFALAGKIEGLLRAVVRRERFDRLIAANVFSLPMHLPLAVALERVINEFKIATIARNHDFWWERERYLKSHCFEFFSRWYPPKSDLVTQVTINSLAREELERRTGLKSVIVGDCFDFKGRVGRLDSYSRNWRRDFGLTDGDIVFLQATRIVARKQIELAMELVSRLSDARVILVLAGHEGDENGSYLEKLKEVGRKLQIRTKYIGKWVGPTREVRGGRRVYTLWDCFANCDWVTYPSAVEGFGNQFIEAMAFKKPIFINRYPVYKADLEPLGFETVAINGEVTENAVERVRRLVGNSHEVKRMTEKNFTIGRSHFSYEATAKKLSQLGF